eukprot:gnl/TRDRNA2_/TRDRNA2_135686_c0_seq1.p1 gnl/TRDRNA2_/TRDRNA2_135686_c0~~gnl/TRDRNA2_/TRDRNA2_135686_c0_seq1.p1  ORF type:complete len:580 (+),score=194.19 gnl/TRDRNA2_/TRDRNA2_135686_c0_seq1:45-1742(+)
MDALGILRPDVVTRISTFMDGRVQKYIEKLEELGFAYGSKGSVYFDIDNFKRQGYDYRKLVPAANTSAAEMEEGEGALAAEDGEKRNPNDFAVWKASKPGEPAWESKWGPGRPGWHIECSVMATEVMDEYLDVHAGGEDLKFPHHDNEMAQSEAYLGRAQWVNYFWHAGHLHIEGLKMSKSLKNFITIRQAMSMHTARQLRIMFCMQPWDKGMNYSDQAIDMAKSEERKFKHFLGSLRFFKRFPHSKGADGEREASILKSVAATEEGIDIALKDNFNTSKVIELLSKLVSECYPSFEALPAAKLAPVDKVAELLTRILGMLGITGLDPVPADEAAQIPVLDAFAGLRQELRELVKAKASAEKILDAVKASRDKVPGSTKGDAAKSLEAFRKDLEGLANLPAGELLKRCDQVRDKDFVALGVRLEDRGADKFAWMFDERTALERELAEVAEKAKAASLQKLINKLGQKRQELKAAEKAAVKPEVMFKEGASAALYSAFDADGVPTKLSSGEEVSAKKKKDFAKELAKQQKEHEKLLKQAGSGGVEAVLNALRKDVKDLEAQVGPDA